MLTTSPLEKKGQPFFFLAPEKEYKTIFIVRKHEMPIDTELTTELQTCLTLWYSLNVVLLYDAHLDSVVFFFLSSFIPNTQSGWPYILVIYLLDLIIGWGQAAQFFSIQLS